MFKKLLNIRKNNYYLLLILVGLSVLPILIIGGSSISYFNRYVGNQLKETYNAGLVQLETDLEQEILDISKAADILVLATAHLELDEISRECISDFKTIEMVYMVWDLMDILMQTSRFIHSIYYLNGEKDFLLSSDRRALPFETFFDQSWAGSLSGGSGYFELSPRELPDHSGINVFTMIINSGRYITDSDGYFAVNINLDGLSEWIETLNENQNTDYLVFNEKNEYMTGTSFPSTVSNVKDSENLIFQRRSIRGWEYVLKVPDRIFNSFVIRTIFLMILMTGLLLVLVAIFSIYVSNRLYSPIENVIRIIERNEAIVPDSSEEISFIGDLFIKMISEQKGLRYALEQNSQAIKESLLRRLFLGDPVDRTDVLEQLNGGMRPLSPCKFCSAVVQLLPGGANLSVSDSGPAQAMAVRAYEAEDSEHIRVIGAPLDLERIILLISTDDEGQIETALLRVRAFLESSLSMEPLVSVGGLYDSIEDVVDSFSDALDILDRTIPDLNEHIIFHHDGLLSAEGQKDFNHYPGALEAQLIEVLRQGDSKRAESLVRDFVKEIAHDDYSHRDRVEVAILSLISGIVKALGDSGISGSEMGLGNYYRDFLSRDVSIEHAEKWLLSFIGHILDNPPDRDPREENYRFKIQEYIQDNYHKDISLELIADWMGISYSYLRKIFRNLFNTTFLDYIHSIRIERARELLRETNLNIGEIAHSVGYMNTARLNRNFKKIIGCMPNEYRARVRKAPDS